MHFLIFFHLHAACCRNEPNSHGAASAHTIILSSCSSLSNRNEPNIHIQEQLPNPEQCLFAFVYRQWAAHVLINHADVLFCCLCMLQERAQRARGGAAALPIAVSVCICVPARGPQTRPDSSMLMFCFDVMFCFLFFACCRNEPNVHKEEQLPNPEGWHGAQLSLTIEGNWSTYRSKIIK